MRRDSLRWMMAVSGMVFVFLIPLSHPLHAGYVVPGQTETLLNEVSTFVSDFKEWNALHNGLPMQVLSTAPTADESEAVLFLFWMWLHDPEGFGAGNLSPGSSTPVGTIGAGPNGNGPTPTPTGGGSNSGSSLGLKDSPTQNGGNNEKTLVGSPGLGSVSPQTDPGPFDPTPEPASVTLLAVGGLGLLLGWRARSRKSPLS